MLYECDGHILFDSVINWWESLPVTHGVSGCYSARREAGIYKGRLLLPEDSFPRMRVSIRKLPDHVRLTIFTRGPDQTFMLRSDAARANTQRFIEISFSTAVGECRNH